MCEQLIDEKIAPLVRWLNARGFPTIGSCEGGEGHAFPRPTVQVRTGENVDQTRDELAAELIRNGAQGFTLRAVTMYQRSTTPEPYSFVELEFWNQPTLSYFVS